MHEQSLMADLIRKILSVSLMNGGAKVAGLKVKLGALAHISPEHLMEHFVEAAKDTVAEGARVDIDVETDQLALCILLVKWRVGALRTDRDILRTRRASGQHQASYDHQTFQKFHFDFFLNL